MVQKFPIVETNTRKNYMDVRKHSCISGPYFDNDPIAEVGQEST